MFILFFSLTNYIILLLTVYESRSDDTVESLSQKSFRQYRRSATHILGIGRGYNQKVISTFQV